MSSKFPSHSGRPSSVFSRLWSSAWPLKDDLTYDVDPDIPDQLIGDFLRLQQVITKLVRNAIEFTPNKGHVSLSCHRLALDQSTVTLEVCVSDNWIGIAKDKLNMISDAFAQADCSTIMVRAASYICSSANKPDFLSKGIQRRGSKAIHIKVTRFPYAWEYVDRKRGRRGQQVFLQDHVPNRTPVYGRDAGQDDAVWELEHLIR